MGVQSRLIGVDAAGVGGIFLMAGTSFLALIPRAVVGGALLYLGLAFLAEWLYDAWFQLPRLDYILVVAIMIMIDAVGLLPGIVLGLAIAVVLFVVIYSRIDVVKHERTGASTQSRVTRSQRQRQILRARGDELAIFQLQGFLFFGTANTLYERMRHRIHGPDQRSLRFVVIDFGEVTGLDSTALISFARMQQLAQAHGVVLVFTQLARAAQERFRKAGLQGEEEGVMREFADLDHGLEWCENELLRIAGATGEDRQTLQELFAAIIPEATNLASLFRYLERRTAECGAYLMRQGDPPEDMYFVESGQVTAQMEPADGPPVRLETMHGGSVVGELGFYLGNQRTAAIVVDEPSIVYRLSRRDLQRMEEADPDAAAVLHRIVAQLLAERVVHLNTMVDGLQP